MLNALWQFPQIVNNKPTFQVQFLIPLHAKSKKVYYHMADFLKQLNDSQSEAVVETEGPVMVIAGAGSGKTRVLTYRIAYLLSKGVSPFSILALTFTNKAAREMKERIASLVGYSKAQNLWMGTFHSVFARILRAEAVKMGFNPNFTIYDTTDSKRLLKKIIKEQNLDEKAYHPGFVLSRISNAKNNLISAVDYNEDFEIQINDQQANKPKIGTIYSIYQNRLSKASAMDFDDLLFFTNVLLRDFPDVLYKYQKKFNYILVDEYQDTNYSQYIIVKKLAADNENICIVGDDAQSIYAFRGANIANILNFKNDYPAHKLFKLEQNYRSTQLIVKAANGIIKNNKEQIFKEIWTANDTGEKIRVINLSSEAEEAAMVGNTIYRHKMNSQLPNSDFAVLYRTNAQSRAIEESLRKLNIPYRVYGGVSFYQRKEVKDILAYFRLIINPYDEDALTRIINFPARGIGTTTLNKLMVAADENNTSVWDVVENPSKYKVALNSGLMNRLEAFANMIKSFKIQMNKLNAFEIGKKIAKESGILKHYFEENSPEAINRKENVEELINGLSEFCEKVKKNSEQTESEENENPASLEVFMSDIALLTDQDTEDDAKETNKVSLMTIHSAKGLEFPHVFLVGVEENLFPSILSTGSRSELEEERRLFYVAVTRAMKSITISYCDSRFKYGNFNFCEPSRFIDELNHDCIEETILTGKQSVNDHDNISNDVLINTKSKNINTKLTPLNKSTKKKLQHNDNSEYNILDPASLKANMTIQHQRFGQGKIIEIDGNNDNAQATVLFSGFGKKKLLLKYAKLKIVA